MNEKNLSINIDTKTQGVESIQSLAARLEDLARTAGPELREKALQGAAALKQLSEQQEAITNFKRLEQEVLLANRALGQAQKELSAYERQLASIGPPTEKEINNQNRLRAGVDELKAVLNSKTRALEASSDVLHRYGIASTEAGSVQKRLQAETSALRGELQSLVPAYKGAADGARASGEQMERTHRRIGEGVDSISQQLNRLQALSGALLTGGFAGGMIKDVADTADAYNNLSARIKLAVGDQASFERGFEGVKQVARDTSTALESTGTLYARIVTAGKEFGVSQSDALALTRSINQAIQLSGASAQASDAAVTQLIQGLQSGMLRGEEFNSVMEQAPRLAKALADGLGVTTGQLRQMAQEGRLSAQTVIESIQKQKSVLDEEFKSLPATVGRAITNLQTQWMLFVGDLDKSSLATASMAQGINLLADNLDTVGRVAAVAGSMLAAQLAVTGVNALRSYATQATVAAGASNLLAASISKIPSTVNIVVATVGFEVGFQIGEMLRENSALARKLGVGIAEFFTGLVNDLRLVKDAATAIFTSDTVQASFDRYVTRARQMQESFALMYKDAEQAPEKIGAATEGAVQKTRELGASGTAAGGQITSAAGAASASVLKVKDAAEEARSALNALAADLNKKKLPDNGLQDIVKNLEQAKARGIELGSYLEKNLPEAIGKMAGPELAAFRSDFIVAMGIAGSKAADLETGLRLIGQQAAQSLGVDVPAAFNQVSPALNDADKSLGVLIKSFPELKAAGVSTSDVVAQALSKMIDVAKSRADIDTIRTRIEALKDDLAPSAKTGLLKQLEQQALDLKAALDQSTPGINSLAEAMKNLGLKSREELQKTADKARESYDYIIQKGQQEGESHQAWTERKRQAALAMWAAVIEAQGGFLTEAQKAEAQMAGLEVQSDATGKTILRAMTDAARATDGAGAAAGRAAGQFTQLSDAARRAAQEEQKRFDAEQQRRYGRPGEQQLPDNAPEWQRQRNDPHGRPVSSAEMVDEKNPYGRTSDGMTRKQSDGAAAGTFNNQLPVQKAYQLLEATRRGGIARMSRADYEEAVRQAQAAYDDMQAFLKLNPGGASMEYIQSTTALYNAARTVQVEFTDGGSNANGVGQRSTGQTAPSAGGSQPARQPAAPPPAASSGASTRTVNVNLSGIGTVSTDEAGSAVLQKLLSQLSAQKSRAL